MDSCLSLNELEKKDSKKKKAEKLDLKILNFRFLKKKIHYVIALLLSSITF